MGTVASVGLTYCACSSVGSLCNTCLGSTAEGTTGRKRSVLLLTIAIAMALWFQYHVGPSIVQETGWVWRTYRAIPGSGKMVFRAWKDGCEEYTGELLSQCAGIAGVYRPTFLAFLFFVLSAVMTRIVPSLNREAWPAKFGIFFFGMLVTMFLHNHPLFAGFFLWTARFGACLFVILQQVILIDVAYNWNDDWVEKSNECDRISYGGGDKWLRAIVAMCVLLYSVVIVGISLLYRFFDGCPENTWIITLTLLGVLVMTAVQLSGQDGSLLTSAVISVYSTYLCYSVVSKNPNGHCNPQIAHDDVGGIVVGLSLTALSLAWTGWSWSAEYRLNAESVQSTKSMAPTSTPRNPDNINLDVPFLDPDEAPTTGMVLDESRPSNGSSSSDSAAAEGGGGGGGGTDLWKLNVVMALICCWVAMILTGWGTLQQDVTENENAANPTVGRVNMAIIGVSQWMAMGLYIWTLVAPRLYPDYDFS